MPDTPGSRRVSANPADEQSLAQIREILFGEQARQTSQQLTQLETHLGEQERALRTLLDQRIAAVSEAVEALRGDLGDQDERQVAALIGVEGALHALLDSLDNRLTLLDSDLQDSHQRLEGAVADQATALHSLQQTGLGRGQLADMLESIVRQLRGQSAK